MSAAKSDLAAEIAAEADGVKETLDELLVLVGAATARTRAVILIDLEKVAGRLSKLADQARKAKPARG